MKHRKSFHYKYVHLSMLFDTASDSQGPEYTVKGNEQVSWGHNHPQREYVCSRLELLYSQNPPDALLATFINRANHLIQYALNKIK